MRLLPVPGGTDLDGDKLTLAPYPANLDGVKMHADTYHHGNLKAALLAEASTLMEERGLESLSLRAIAKRLGVSHAAPAHHFGNRAVLLAELAADGYAGLADAMEAGMADADPEGWLRAAGRAYVRFAVDHPQRYRLMFGSGLLAEDCPERLRQESTRAFLDLLTAVYQRTPDGDPARYRMAAEELGAWAAVHGTVMLWLDGQLGTVESEERFLELVDAVLGS